MRENRAMKVALALMPDSRSCIPPAVRAQLFSLDVSQPSPSRKGVPPLGVATLTAYLREHGVDVTAYDFRTDVTGSGSDQIRHLSEEARWVCESVALELVVPLLDRYFAGGDVESLLRIDREAPYYRRFAKARGMFLGGLMASLDELHELVAAALDTWSRYDLVGFGTYQSNMYAVMLACMALRRRNPGQAIIAGGPEVTQSTNTARLLLYAGLVDAVIPGDALGPTLGVIQARESNTPLAGVAGIMTLDGGEIVRTPDAPVFTIDALPFPDFSDFPPMDYFPFTYPIGTSRGCPFRCNFCSEKIMFGTRFRRMSTDAAYAHVQQAVRSLRCQKIFFGDSLVNTSDRWLEALAERMIDDGLGISWEAYFRATTNRPLLSLLKRSGLTRAVIGLESISDELLAVMIKRQTAASNIGAIDAFLGEGIPISLSLIVGYPGETEREHDDLVALLWALTERNKDVGRRVRAEYASAGFRSLPSQAHPEVCGFPLPFYLKPMSEIFDTPREFGLRVTPYGDTFAAYAALPARVRDLLASMPYTFESDQIPTAEVFRRLNRVESVPHLKGELTSFGQRLHTMFHGLRESDRIVMSRPAAFADVDGGGALVYRSAGLGMDISCPDVSRETLRGIAHGGTLGELFARCTTGTEGAKVQLKHMLAMAAVEDSVQVTLSDAPAQGRNGS
jgi:radical SAM superfamily enzyme YgiQ (UPF0313 family)